MQDTKWQEFSQRMAYEGSLHMKVEPLDNSPDILASYNERNLHVLRALASLDERRADGAEDDNPLMQELLRMDSKINVLMEVVNRLLIPIAQLPAQRVIRFNALGIIVPQDALPAAEQLLLVSLHFDACRALPLELPGFLERRSEDGSAYIAFIESNEMVEDGLERFVFRHHRRKVAEARAMTP